MKSSPTKLEGCFIIEFNRYEDYRGVFYEAFNQREFQKTTGLNVDFVQDNISVSKKNVLRGLHFQSEPYEQAKLVQVVRGEVLDVIVDIRKDSKTFGQHIKMKLTAESGKAIFIPKGMAHGFLTLSDEVIFLYKCDNYYQPDAESGIIFNDEKLNIDWNLNNQKILISEKDIKLDSLALYIEKLKT